MNSKILEISNLSLSYNQLLVLKKLNIHVNEGEFVSIIGPSGCGKTTLFNIIAGLLPASEGQVFIKNQKIKYPNNQVAYMYQKDLLLPWRKIIDNVGLAYEISGMEKKEIKKNITPYFKMFDLVGFENYYPHQLSGGMRQRVALMRTYLCNKDIMLLDEPFASLDAITKLKMQEWLKDFSHKMSTTNLFITHDIEEAIFLSDRIYVLSDRPATIIDEVIININKENYYSCTTSKEFNQLKAKIMNLLAK